MGAPVVHFEIAAGDAAALGEFYNRVFDWAIEGEAGYGYLDTGAGQGIDGGLREVDDSSSRYLAVYVQVDDVAAALARATEAGGLVLLAPTEAGRGTVGLFQDPEGNVVGVLSSGGGEGPLVT